MAYADKVPPPVQPSCRWCGSGLNKGYVYCPICHRSQGRLHGILGPTSNWIAVIATLITFGQLMVSVQQNNSAIRATQQGEAALKQVQEERSRIEEIKGRIQQLEKSTQESSHATTDALLQIKAIDASVKELSAPKQREIKERTDAVEKARKTYEELQQRLAQVSPTVDVPVQRTITEQHCTTLLLGNKMCIPEPRVIIEVQKGPNPDFVALRQQVDQASLVLKAAETALSESLAK